MTSVVWICCLLIASIEASCPWEGKQICEGAVTKELSTLVKICVDGKLKLKKKTDIAPGWPKAGGGIYQYVLNFDHHGKVMISLFRVCLVWGGAL